MEADIPQRTASLGRLMSDMREFSIILIIAAMFSILLSFGGCWLEMGRNNDPVDANYFLCLLSLVFLVLACILNALANINEKLPKIASDANVKTKRKPAVKGVAK